MVTVSPLKEYERSWALLHLTKARACSTPPPGAMVWMTVEAERLQTLTGPLA